MGMWLPSSGEPTPGYIETETKELCAVSDSVDVVGPDNNRAILHAVLDAPLTICAWGDGGDHGQQWKQSVKQRAEEVRKLLEPYKKRLNLYCFGLNNSGEPKHPRRAQIDEVVALEPYEPWNQT